MKQIRTLKKRASQMRKIGRKNSLVSSTHQDVSCISFKMEIKWNKKNFCRGYEKGIKSTQMRYNKFAQDLEKEASETYNIEALWQ